MLVYELRACHASCVHGLCVPACVCVSGGSPPVHSPPTVQHNPIPTARPVDGGDAHTTAGGDVRELRGYSASAHVHGGGGQEAHGVLHLPAEPVASQGLLPPGVGPPLHFYPASLQGGQQEVFQGREHFSHWGAR